MPSNYGSSSASPFDQAVDAATNDKNQEDDWALILDICDKVQSMKDGSRDVLRSVFKRINHRNQTVANKAVVLLDACVSNCGKKFASEIGSRDAVLELRKISDSSNKAAEKLRQLIKKWAEGGDLKSESLIVQLNNELKSGSTVYSTVSFADSSSTKARSGSKKISAQELQEKEIEDLARAMALSMQEAQAKPNTATPSTPSNTPAANGSNQASLYPAMMAGSASAAGNTSIASTMSNSNEPRKVRALYDFEAAEENELTFKTGDIIFVLDDSDANWWRGYTLTTPNFTTTDGLLFPSNFVTSDLAYQPAPESATKKAQEPAAANQPAAVDQAQVVIDEAKIDRGLALIQAADPTGEQRPDSDELLRIEQECRFMVPLVDAELEKVDGLHAKLTEANQSLVNAFAEYHRVMAQEDNDKRHQMAAMPQQAMYGMPQAQYYDPSAAPGFIPAYGVPPQGAMPYYQQQSPMPPAGYQANGYSPAPTNGTYQHQLPPQMNLQQIHQTMVYGGQMPQQQQQQLQQPQIPQNLPPQQQPPQQFQPHQMPGQV